MTKEQYERWKDFAMRMAKATIRVRRCPSRRQVLECIDFFFECRMEPNEWSRVRDWDHTHSEGSYHATPVCDHLSELAEYWIPNYWSVDEDKYEKAYDKWVGPVACCIRAGLDVAVNPSAGVVGYTVGDLRRMYPDGIPGWVQAYFKKPITRRTKDKTPVWL